MSRVIAVGHKLFAFSSSAGVVAVVISYLLETTTGANLTETGTSAKIEES